MKFRFIIVLFLFGYFGNSCHEERNKAVVQIEKSNQDSSDFSKFDKLYKLHKKLGKPQEGDWLYHYHEEGQTIAEYCLKNPVRPSDKRNRIYILPIGKFSKTEKELISTTAEYVGIFFMLEVKMLDPISVAKIPEDSRRMNDFGEQLQTGYILDSLLRPNIPADAISYIAITNKDLYPDENWNYVFGQASLKNRTGVSSYCRYFDNKLDTGNYKICLERTISTTTHEICHMFSMKHCKDYECVLNGSNHLAEADSKPLWLCPECLAKLQWCINFDLMKRYDRLIGFFSLNNFVKEKAFCIQSKLILENSNKVQD